MGAAENVAISPTVFFWRRDRLARVFPQRRLVFERVHLADATFHEQEDATLRLGRDVLGTGPQAGLPHRGVAAASSRPRSRSRCKDVEQRHAPEAEVGIQQEPASRLQVRCLIIAAWLIT